MCLCAEKKVLFCLGQFTEIAAKCRWDESGSRMKDLSPLSFCLFLIIFLLCDDTFSLQIPNLWKRTPFSLLNYKKETATKDRQTLLEYLIMRQILLCCLKHVHKQSSHRFFLSMQQYVHRGPKRSRLLKWLRNTKYRIFIALNFFMNYFFSWFFSLDILCFLDY